MSRSGYSDDCENVELWQANVRRAAGCKRGQAFFLDLIAALDAIPEKRLVAGELQTDEGETCALGSLAKRKGAELEPDDTYDYEKLGKTFNIASMLAQEVMYQNDEGGPWRPYHQAETPEERWTRVRKWAAEQVRATPSQRKESQ